MRFLLYAAYVRHTDFSECVFKEEVLLFCALVSCDGRKTFLPQLPSLEWSWTPEVSGSLAILIPPSLTVFHLDIDASTPVAQIEEYIQCISSLAPMISDLKIPSTTGRSISSLGSFRHLQHLSLQSNLFIPDLSEFELMWMDTNDILVELRIFQGRYLPDVGAVE